MAQNIPLIVFPAKDLDKAKKFFNAFLETTPYADSAWYVGYKVGELEVGLDPSGKTVVSYIAVDDIEASLKTLLAAGAKIIQEPKDVANGLLVAQVELDDNVLGLRQQPK